MQKKAFTEWQQEAFRDTNLALSNLRTSASNLRLQSSFNAYSATSSDSSSVTVSTTANAVSGTYKVEVTSIASSAKMHSASAIKNEQGVAAKSTGQIAATGTITVKDSKGSTGNIPTIVVTEGMTYADVAKKLQDSTAGQVPELRVSFDDTTSRFFISTKGMGTDQNFTLEFDNEALARQVINNGNATIITTDNATDGSVKFDGIEINGLKTNRTTVNGLILDLTKAGQETTVTVQSNPEKPLAMIKDFVEKYNETISNIEKQLIEKRYPAFQPLSDAQKKDMTETEIELWEEKARSGLLRNDPTLKKAMQDLRRAFMDQVEGIAAGNVSLLSQIGINTGSYTEGGKLFIDEAKLTEALNNKPDEVMKLFTNKSADGTGLGVGDRVYRELNEIVKNLSSQAGSPSSSVDNSTISKKIRQMTEEISRWEDRMKRIEDRYWKQFTAMEKALSQMNSQSMWMQQNMFGGM
jgi:flagellar hook-associated protein 2